MARKMCTKNTNFYLTRNHAFKTLVHEEIVQNFFYHLFTRKRDQVGTFELLFVCTNCICTWTWLFSHGKQKRLLNCIFSLYISSCEGSLYFKKKFKNAKVRSGLLQFAPGWTLQILEFLSNSTCNLTRHDQMSFSR